MKKNAVEFKGTKDGVIIYCLEEFSFQEILNDLALRLEQRAAFFADANVRVDVGDRELTPEEQARLAGVIQQYSRMNLIGIQTRADRGSVPPAGRKRGSLDDLKTEGFKEGRSLVIKRTLRSGQGIHFPGNVIVLGDVNPGAEIVAEGDIYVFGTIRGIAHAGAKGDRSASVVALRLAPTQLRIADVISRAPDEGTLMPEQAEYAFISEDRIMIASIATKTQER